MNEPQAPPAGWYPDPQRPGMLRYWDGARWSEHVTAASQPTAPARTSATSGKAIAALVLGIIGLVAWFIPFFGLPISVTGVILGATSLKSPSRKMAIIGLTLCVVALVLTVGNAAYGAYLGITGQHPLTQWLQNSGS